MINKRILSAGLVAGLSNAATGAVVMTGPASEIRTTVGVEESLEIDLDEDGIPDFRLRASYPAFGQQTPSFVFSLVPFTGPTMAGEDRDTAVASSLADASLQGSILSQAPAGSIDAATRYADSTGMNPALSYVEREAYLASDIVFDDETSGEWMNMGAAETGFAYFTFTSYLTGSPLTHMGFAEIEVVEPGGTTNSPSVAIISKGYESIPIPEPSTGLLGLLGCCFLLRRRR